MTKKSAPHAGAGSTVAIKSITTESERLDTAKNAVSEHVLAAADRYIAASHASATVRAYASDARHFAAFGGTIPTTAKFLCYYLAHCAEQKLAVATIERRVTAIHCAHIELNAESPVSDRAVRRTMQGIRRTLGTRQKPATPILKDDLLHMILLAARQKPVKAKRDAAILLCGFAGSFRRDEIVSIRLRDITRLSNGIEVFLPTSKTDQAGEGRTVFIPYATGSRCPVHALDEWLAVADIRAADNFVFRAVNRHDQVWGEGLSAKAVTLIVKSSAERIGLVDNDTERYSAHGLRAGFVTQATMSGLQPFQIMEQTGHKSVTTVARYTRVVNRRKLPSLL